MALTPLALFLALARQPKDQYTLGVLGDTFVIGNGARKETLTRVVHVPDAKKALSFRRDKRWAVWDERGLTTRDGDWTSSDRLEAVPVSPKIATKEEIAAVRAKHRNRTASGLSGARRIGSVVYFLPRWDEKDGTPWREALVEVDLAKPHPKPRLLGAFAGLSLGSGPLDDRLDLVKGRPSAIVRNGDAWGLATYEPKGATFDFQARGTGLIAYDDGRIVERTGYGTVLVGRYDEALGRPIPWLETHGKPEFVPGEGPVLVRVGDRLRNAVTGAETRLAKDAAVRRSRFGVLVFWPESAPHSARLLDDARLEERARWEKGTK